MRGTNSRSDLRVMDSSVSVVVVPDIVVERTRSDWRKSSGKDLDLTSVDSVERSDEIRNLFEGGPPGAGLILHQMCDKTQLCLLLCAIPIRSKGSAEHSDMSEWKPICLQRRQFRHRPIPHTRQDEKHSTRCYLETRLDIASVYDFLFFRKVFPWQHLEHHQFQTIENQDETTAQHTPEVESDLNPEDCAEM